MDVGLGGARGKGLLAYIGVGNAPVSAGQPQCHVLRLSEPHNVPGAAARADLPGLAFWRRWHHQQVPGRILLLTAPKPLTQHLPPTKPAPRAGRGVTSRGSAGRGHLGSSVSKQQLWFGEGARCCLATTVLAWAQRCSLLQVHDHLAGPHARRLLPLHRPQPHGSPAAAPDRGAGGL